MMRKKKVLFLIPFLLVAGFLFYCWTTILRGEFPATLEAFYRTSAVRSRHPSLFQELYKSCNRIRCFSALATFNALAITPAITSSWLNTGGRTTPPVQLLSLGLLVLYVILSLDTLIDIQLDYKEGKVQKVKVD
jgi:hypothetical protein